MLKQYFVIDTGVCNKYLKLLVHKYPQTLWSNCKHLLLWYTAKFIKFKHICSTTSSHKHILLPLAYSPGVARILSILLKSVLRLHILKLKSFQTKLLLEIQCLLHLTLEMMTHFSEIKPETFCVIRARTRYKNVP